MRMLASPLGSIDTRIVSLSLSRSDPEPTPSTESEELVRMVPEWELGDVGDRGRPVPPPPVGE